MILHSYGNVNSIKKYYKGEYHMFFQRLKDLREDKQLLQDDIAKLLGIQQTVYSRYERGFQPIPVKHLLTLANFYKTSTDFILGRTNNPKPPIQ